MSAINSLDNIINLLIKNKDNLKPIPFIKIDSLKIYYDIKLEGLYVLKLITNSKYLSENQFILEYSYDYQDIINYIKNNYLENIQLVEKYLTKEIEDTKQYIIDNCSSFKDILKVLKHAHDLYYELVIEAYTLKLEKPNLKYDIKVRKLDLYDDTKLVSSRYNILRKR